MIKTYTRTLFKKNLEEATFELHFYTKSKFDDTYNFEDEIVDRFTGVKSWDIVEGGKEAEAIERDEYNYYNIDENHEYLVLHFKNGKHATFRNSTVDMFIW